MCKPMFACAALTITLIAMSGAVQAGKEEDRERQAVRRAQLMVKKVEEEKAQIAQERDQLAEQLKKITGENAALKQDHARNKGSLSRDLGSVRQELELSRRELDSARTELDTIKVGRDKFAADLEVAQRSLADLAQKYSEAERGLQKLTDEKASLDRTLSANLAACEEKNLRLYKIGVELLDRYKNKGVFQAIRQAEPFTQLEWAGMENLLAEYREKLDGQRAKALGEQGGVAPRP